MFLPPDQRRPGPPPRPQRPPLSKRDETRLLWIACFVLVMLVIAPIGGSTVLDLVSYLLHR